MRRYESLISTLPCAVYDYARWPDGRTRFLYISPQCESIFDIPAAEITANPHVLWSMVHAEDLVRLKNEDESANEENVPFQSEVRIVLTSGRERWIQLTSKPGDRQVDGQMIWSGVILDITERKQAELERVRLVEKLQSALAEDKVLSGFLPICATCKKIRDDRGYWKQLEAYFSDHSELQFSHGICPDCAEDYLAELARCRTRASNESTTRPHGTS